MKPSQKKMDTDARVISQQVLLSILKHHHSLTPEQLKPLEKLDDPRDRRWAREIIYGVMRWRVRLDAIISRLLNKPIKAKDQDVHIAILMGLYQLIYMRTPDHAAVSVVVNLVKRSGKPWATGLVNASLRRFIREQDKLSALVDQNDAVRLSHPDWLFSEFKKNWPQQAELIMKNNNTRAPMTLRVNKNLSARNEYSLQLTKKSIAHTCSELQPDAITLEQPMESKLLPGYDAGVVSVQDSAAQCAAALLCLRKGNKVLDACAAPGGKSAHILESCSDLESLTVLDIDPVRVESIKKNMQRLRLPAANIKLEYKVMDALFSGKALATQRFDRILLDAPCSATGVIRRHPDIKFFRRPADIEKLLALQYQLLTTLWSLLAPKGILLYATCSIFNTENSQQIQQFLAANDNARELPFDMPWALKMPVGCQILPGNDLNTVNADGFYYARIQRVN